MFGLGLPELFVIFFIVLIVFGAGKLPEIGVGLGKALRGFKKGMADSDETASRSMALEQKENIPK